MVHVVWIGTRKVYACLKTPRLFERRWRGRSRGVPGMGGNRSATRNVCPHYGDPWTGLASVPSQVSCVSISFAVLVTPYNSPGASGRYDRIVKCDSSVGRDKQKMGFPKLGLLEGLWFCLAYSYFRPALSNSKKMVLACIPTHGWLDKVILMRYQCTVSTLLAVVALLHAVHFWMILITAVYSVVSSSSCMKTCIWGTAS